MSEANGEDKVITDISDILGTVKVETEGESIPEPDVKPKRARGSRANAKADSKRTPVPPYRQGQFIEPVADFYQTIGMVTYPFNPEIASSVIAQATACGEAWDEMAKRNDSVRRFLLRMQEGGAWGSLLMAHVPIALAVMANSKPGLMGPIIERMNQTGDEQA